jgi:hypothetical protein
MKLVIYVSVITGGYRYPPNIWGKKNDARHFDKGK